MCCYFSQAWMLHENKRQPAYQTTINVFVYTRRSLNWWTSDECNMINGTNGASFHPVLTKNEMLYMFSSDLCRWLKQHLRALNIFSIWSSIYLFFWFMDNRSTILTKHQAVWSKNKIKTTPTYVSFFFFKCIKMTIQGRHQTAEQKN